LLEVKDFQVVQGNALIVQLYQHSLIRLISLETVLFIALLYMIIITLITD